MPQIVTAGAEGDQIPGVVRAASCAGDDMVDVQIASVMAALAPALVPVTGQNFPPGFGRDGAGVAFAGFVDGGVAVGGC